MKKIGPITVISALFIPWICITGAIGQVVSSAEWLSADPAKDLPMITALDAIDAAEALANEVGDYTRHNPRAPGAFSPWLGPVVPQGEALLVHEYSSGQPVYYVVTLVNSDDGQRSIVTLRTTDGRWLSYGADAGNYTVSMVTRDEAARYLTSASGRTLSRDDVLLVSLPNKSLYWAVRDPDGSVSHSVIVNWMDAEDVRVGPEAAALMPPRERIESPRPQSQSLEHDREGWRYPSFYYLSVPFHPQQTNFHCAPASVEMVFDYWGPDIDQTDIGHVGNTNPGGTTYSNSRRCGHFSGMSTAILDPSLQGYHERALGYGALECEWSFEPDYPDRYNDLKELISTGFPVEIGTWYDATHAGGHARVVKGYDELMNTFIVHDPWIGPPIGGPDVHFAQDFLVDDLWRFSSRWGLLLTPWQVDITTPDSVQAGESFTVSVNVVYTGPHPFEQQDPAEFPHAEIYLPPLLDLAPGETSVQSLLPDLEYSGSAALVAWELVAEPGSGLAEIEVRARGVIHDSADAYPSYTDSIGGWASTEIVVSPMMAVAAVDDRSPERVALSGAVPNPFNPQTTIVFEIPRAQEHLIAVYDLLGRPLRTLASGHKAAGRHSVVWDGRDSDGRALPSGTYIVRLQAESGVETRKVMLVR